MNKLPEILITIDGEKVLCFSHCVECGKPLVDEACVSLSDVWVVPPNEASKEEFISYPSEVFCGPCNEKLDRDFLWGV